VYFCFSGGEEAWPFRSSFTEEGGGRIAREARKGKAQGIRKEVQQGGQGEGKIRTSNQLEVYQSSSSLLVILKILAEAG